MDSSVSGERVEKAVLRKVTLRLIPFIFLLFVLNILDRVNVGFARLQMLEQLGLSEQVFGLGSGIFFLGYFFFQLPSNLILNRVGARRWISGIVIGWGMISTAMLFIRGETSFYALRFVLGMAEAGFFPGMILYLSYWIPARERAKATASFMTAAAVAGIVGGPISGALMQYLDRAAGLAGWQWMFLLEGLPTIALGIVAIFWLTDRPESARWLAPEERTWLSDRMRREEQQREQRHGMTLSATLSNPAIWLLSALYLTLAMGSNGFALYLPELVRVSFPDRSKVMIGLLAAIPYILAVVAMVLSGARSDRTGERRWHVAIAAFLAAAGWALAGYSQSPWVVLTALTIAAMGMYSTFGPFWSLPNSFLSGRAAAGGIALINSVGNLGGFIAPFMISQVKAATNSFSGGLMAMALTLFLGGVMAILSRHDRAGESATPPDQYRHSDHQPESISARQ